MQKPSSCGTQRNLMFSQLLQLPPVNHMRGCCIRLYCHSGSLLSTSIKVKSINLSDVLTQQIISNKSRSSAREFFPQVRWQLDFLCFVFFLSQDANSLSNRLKHLWFINLLLYSFWLSNNTPPPGSFNYDTTTLVTVFIACQCLT